MHTLAATPLDAAHVTAHDSVPWVPLGDGKAFKPLRFLRDDRGFVELLRLDAGVAVSLHRHTGDVHACNLQGTRELHTGERVGPGDYVYEPAGNTDTWKAVGDEPLIVLVVVMGAVEYLGPDNAVVARYTAESLRALYLQYCEENGIDALDLVS